MNGQSAVLEKGEVLHHGVNGKTAEYAGETYYNLPPVKHSAYRWAIGTSFFALGTGGASQILSAVLDFVDGEENSSLVRTGRYVALAGALIAPALYIEELGAPRKWYNMLRIFRPTSLMSMGGVWALTAFGTSSGMAAAGQFSKDMGYVKAGSLIGRVSGVPGAFTGAFMSVYMGTELEETSTPFWSDVSPFLSPIFGLGNASNAIAVMELTAQTNRAAERTLRRLGTLALLTEAGEVLLLQRINAKRKNRPDRFPLSLLRLIGGVKVASLLLHGAGLFGASRLRRLYPFASLATLAAGYLLPNVILL
ncbi:MAG TPA: NrfD/PsrC family molybdoenzyme membrane anchor subunit, partial [Dissulfurispiraceae bacterium]